MFYSHDILHKRGGKFGIIWIAATKGVPLTKRDYCSVCVSKSCDDIIKYISLRAKPLGHRGSKPRFSLYLSSQLMVGVARVYEKQYSYFIVDVHELHKRTSRLTTSSFDDVIATHIQLKKSARSADFCTMPEPDLFGDEEFGMMRAMLDTSPDPMLLPEIEMMSVSPYRTAKLSTSLLQLSPSQMDKIVMESPSHVVSSASEISLQEDGLGQREEIQVPEMELPPLDGMAELMSEMDQRVGEEEEEEEGKEAAVEPSPDQLWAVDTATGQLILSPSPKGPRIRLRPRLSPREDQIEKLVSPIRGDDLPLSLLHEEGEMMMGEDMIPEEPMDTEAVPPEEEKQKEKGLVTPKGAVLQDILRLSPIESVTPSPSRRRGRKRRLVFADATTQLSKKDIRHNMETVSSLTTKETTVQIKTYPSAKQLFEEPARKALKRSSKLLTLWREHSQLRPAITDPEAEDLDAPAWSIAYTRPPQRVVGSSTETTSPEERGEEEEEEMARFVPEILRQEISASPERLRDISSEAIQAKAKFEDTPQSIVMSDASHLSESKDSSKAKSFLSETSAQRSLLRPTGDSFKDMEEPIPEELIDVQELPLLPEEDLVLEPLEEFMAPEMISTSEDEEGRKTRKGRSREESPRHESPRKDIPHENVLRGIGELTEDDDTMSFKDIVPPSTYRSVAAKIFSVCLEYAAMRFIQMTQEVPYGDIQIQRGPAF